MDVEDFYYTCVRIHKQYRHIMYRDLTVLHRLYTDGILYHEDTQQYSKILRCRVYLKWDTGHIVYLNLSRLLQGYIPEYIMELPDLKYLFLECCSLDSIPDFLGQLPSLYHLYLDNNPIQYDINQYIDSELLADKYKSLYILSSDQTLIYIN